MAFIITEDGLSSNAPHIKVLKENNFRFILGVKEGDHAYLFNYVNVAHKTGQTTSYQYKEKGIIHRFRYLNQVPLNESNQDVLVNFLEYWEIDGNKTRHFSWVTDFCLSNLIVGLIMRAGRARWKIENEVFNTLKNQNYHFEHNYGHGKKNLSVNFALLMMLAFLVDQIQQLASSLFQALLKKEGSRKRLWEHTRALFFTLSFSSMEDIYKALLYGYEVGNVVISEPN